MRLAAVADRTSTTLPAIQQHSVRERSASGASCCRAGGHVQERETAAGTAHSHTPGPVKGPVCGMDIAPRRHASGHRDLLGLLTFAAALIPPLYGSRDDVERQGG